MGLKLFLVHYLMSRRKNIKLTCDSITTWTTDSKLTLKQWDRITFDIINWKWKYVALIDDLGMEIGPLGCWGVIRWESSPRCCELDIWITVRMAYMSFTWRLKPYVHLCKLSVGINWMYTSNSCKIGGMQPSNWLISFLSSSCVWSRVNHRAIVNRSPSVTYSKISSSEDK